MRPRTLEEFVGQQHILTPGMLLRRAIEADRIQSLIFYGPPGTGKTTLAQSIANRTESKFVRLSGVESNVAEMRQVLAGAANRPVGRHILAAQAGASGRQGEAAWRYVKFGCGLEGNLLRSRHLGYNGPRLGFYDTPQWQEAMAERPNLSNVKEICLAGDKLRHTEIIAVNHQANPVIETCQLHYPDIEEGRGPYTSVEDALSRAARSVAAVFRRYNRQVARWPAAAAAAAAGSAFPAVVRPSPRGRLSEAGD